MLRQKFPAARAIAGTKWYHGNSSILRVRAVFFLWKKTGDIRHSFLLGCERV